MRWGKEDETNEEKGKVMFGEIKGGGILLEGNNHLCSDLCGVAGTKTIAIIQQPTPGLPGPTYEGWLYY